MDKNDALIKDFIETGSDITGSISGALIGGLIAGPPGAIIGGISGPVISKILYKIGDDIRQRFLSPREEVRIGATYSYAIDKIKNNQEQGINLRDASFFENNDNYRSDAEEIFEGIILSAQKEYEERKVKYLGNLYANICTNSQITREHANHLIKTINSLSFRQLCIIQLLKEKREATSAFNFTLRSFDNHTLKISDIIVEIRDLQQKGLISMTARMSDENDNTTHINLNDLSITKNGIDFCNLLGLNEIPKDDLDKLNEVSHIRD